MHGSVSVLGWRRPRRRPLQQLHGVPHTRRPRARRGPQRAIPREVRGTALKFTAGYLVYFVPVAIAIGALANLTGGAARVLGALGGPLALRSGSPASATPARRGSSAAAARCTCYAAAAPRSATPVRPASRSGSTARRAAVRTRSHWRFLRRAGTPGWEPRSWRLRGADGAPIPRAGVARAGALGIAQRVSRNGSAGARSLRGTLARRARLARRTGVPRCRGERRVVIDPTTLVPIVGYAVLCAQSLLHRRRTSGRTDWPRACCCSVSMRRWRVR